MLLLAVSLIGGLFLSNYQLKKKFDKIDTSDPYWNYPIRETGDFHHVQIVGGNLLRSKIIAGDKNQVMREENLKDWLTAEVKDDTLYVDYSDHVETTRKKDAQVLSSFDIYIIVKELHSVNLKETNAELETNTPELLEIILSNNSSADLRKIKAGSSVNVTMDSACFFGIYKQNEDLLSLNNLDITSTGESTVVLSNISVRSGKIKLNHKTKITADAGLLKNLVVE